MAISPAGAKHKRPAGYQRCTNNDPAHRTTWSPCRLHIISDWLPIEAGRRSTISDQAGDSRARRRTGGLNPVVPAETYWQRRGL